MAVIAVVTDTHFGARSESSLFFDNASKFFRETFFPRVDALGIKTVVHLGDLVDRRKYIAYSTAGVMRREFVEPLIDRGIELIIMPGNHDLPFRNLVTVNAEREILPPHPLIRVVERPTVWMMYDRPTLLLPWICDANRALSLDMIKARDTEIAMGHLELVGFEMYRGSVQERGMSPTLFDGYKSVLSGHYHHPSSKGVVSYLGAPYQMTWSDYECPRGFHLLDTTSLALTFVENPHTMYAKDFYSLERSRVMDRDEWRASMTGKIVKLVVGDKQDPESYDAHVAELESLAASVQVVDDHKHADVVVDDTVEYSDTLTLLFNTISDSQLDCDKGALTELLTELYNKAIEIE